MFCEVVCWSICFRCRRFDLYSVCYLRYVGVGMIYLFNLVRINVFIERFLWVGFGLGCFLRRDFFFGYFWDWINCVFFIKVYI